MITNLDSLGTCTEWLVWAARAREAGGGWKGEMGLEPGGWDEGWGWRVPRSTEIAKCGVSGAWSTGWKERMESEMGT